MRKLILQMQTSIDAYVAGPEGEMDWMEWNWDDSLKNFVTDLTARIDTILLGRKLAEGFIPHWQAVAENQEDPENSSGVFFHQTPKIVFSKTVETHSWAHTEICKEELQTAVNAIKNSPGKDIIVYGGAELVANLIAQNLIDEYYLFVNPTAIGNGLKIFKDNLKLTLVESTAFECGIVVNRYRPR